MTPNTLTPIARRASRRAQVQAVLLPLLGGTALGFLAALGVLWLTMPGMMLKIHESRFDSVEQTCQELKKAIENAGWNCPGIRDMNQSMAKHGVQFDRPVRIVELCNADYALKVLEKHPEMSTLMPCAFGVYEGPDGKVYISGMNTGLMGKMFGGVIAEVMGKHVAADEKHILSSVIQE